MDDLFTYLLMGLGLFAIFILPILRLINASKTDVKSDSKLLKKQVNAEIEDILLSSKNISVYLVERFDLHYNLVMYEYIMFFIFLEELKTRIRRTPEIYRDLVLQVLFSALEYTNNLDYQNRKNEILEVINLRKDVYTSCFEKYGILTKDFFKKVFEYQAELLVTIKKENKLAKYNPFPNSPLDYTTKNATSLTENYMLTSALLDKVDLFIDYFKR